MRKAAGILVALLSAPFFVSLYSTINDYGSQGYAIPVFASFILIPLILSFLFFALGLMIFLGGRVAIYFAMILVFLPLAFNIGAAIYFSVNCKGSGGCWTIIFVYSVIFFFVVNLIVQPLLWRLLKSL